MGLQELFTEAIHLHSRGRLFEAREKYLQVLHSLPENTNVLGNLAIVCRDIGDFTEALHYGKRAVDNSPGDASQLINLGAIHEALGDLMEAGQCYEKALQVDPSQPKALNNLGKILHITGNRERALELLQNALTLEPNYPLALNNLGVLLSETGDTQTAVSYFERSRLLDPHNADTLYNLAGAYNCLAMEDMAIKILNDLLQIQPEHPSAQHMLAALKGESPDVAPQSYVTETFDSYAERFDVHIQGPLGYTAPAQLAAMLEQARPESFFEQCLDLGCGTGLSGAAFNHLCRTITGVDLSAKMLKKAEEKSIYKQLHCEDIHAFLANTNSLYDLVLAADVFVYLGNLQSFFDSLGKKTCLAGVLGCSIEVHDQDRKYALRSSGRFAHNPDYLIDSAGRGGFRLMASREHGIRRENNQWIPGSLFLFEKTI